MNSAIIFCLIVAAVFLIGVFAHKVTTPWRARRLMKRIRCDIREGRHVAAVHPTTVIWSAEGFSLKSTNADNPDTALSWREITSVTAYKRDFFSYDQICLFFDRRDDEGVEVTEDTNRWNPFLESLHTHLPGCEPRESWYARVMQPAFAENLTAIFVRSSASSKKEAGV